MKKHVAIIGGGLAGTEAAYQLSKRGIFITLFEMRPQKQTAVHETPYLGELVCSNSLGSEETTSASGLLKKELQELDSFFLKTVRPFQVPAGMSFSIDRKLAAKAIDEAIDSIPEINVRHEEITDIPKGFDAIIVATGPLTSPAFSEALQVLTQRRHLHFYDATSPIIDAQSINEAFLYRASRYGKGSADFFNIPLSETQYHAFVKQLVEAETVPLSEVDKPLFYESCLPVEEIARRGPLSLAYGPLKPVGLEDPSTGKTPYAVVQLRQDDIHRNHYQMVGFQTRLKWPEQKKVFSSLPGLSDAVFFRFGRMHRNTYINAPLLLDSFFRFKPHPLIYFCGQISGVEGYVESVASGLAGSLFLHRQLNDLPLVPLPQETAIGSLCHAISNGDWQTFCPTNFTFGLLPDDFTARKVPKKEKKKIKSERALECLNIWKKQNYC